MTSRTTAPLMNSVFRDPWPLYGLYAMSMLAAVGCTGEIGGGAGSGDPNGTGNSASGSGGGGAGNGGGGTLGGAGGSGGVGAQAVSFACNASAPTTTVTPLRRLSVLQYQRTLSDLFSVVPALDPLKTASTALATIPPDAVSAGFAAMDTRISDRHLQAYYDVADALAAAVTADNTKLTGLGGACATQTPSATCINAFLDNFALRAYRRPLTSDERTRYLALNNGSRDGKELFRSLVFSLLLAPQFLHQMEINGTALSGSTTTVTLSGYELASRMSYHFWQTMPDTALFQTAKDGSLLTDAGYSTQVKRLFGDARTQATIKTFYAEWYHLGMFGAFRQSTAFANFAAGTGLADPATGTDFLAGADNEMSDLSAYYTFKAPGTYRDMLLSNLSFARSAPLAKIYGVSPWDGTSTPGMFPSGQRGGILTRVAFLLNPTYTTHPIHRGAMIRRRLLCDELPEPDPSSLPPNALVPPPTDATQTTRQRFENKIVNEPCASCHAFMNPIGYVLERYDSIGRHRQSETIFDDATGAKLNTLPIESSAVPRINSGDTRMVDSGAALTELVADSGRAEACFARQYFRFTFHRVEDATSDACSLEGVRSALAKGKLGDALLAIANSPSFRQRKVQ